MAKYEDYAKARQEAEGTLEEEITEAANQTEQRRQEDNVPERFKGKSREEIAQSFVELEQLASRHGNEVGELRRTVAELVELAKKSAPAEQAPAPVTLDDLYNDPDAAVRRVADRTTTPRIDDLEKRLQQAEQRVAIAEGRAAFETKHSDFKTTMKDPEFIKWIQGSKVRTGLAALADQGNFDAADELFTTYGEIKQLRAAPAPVRSEAARRVALERSGGNAPAQEHTFSRHELQEKRISAQRGDRKAAAWLQAHGAEITEAYAEGRLSA